VVAGYFTTTARATSQLALSRCQLPLAFVKGHGKAGHEPVAGDGRCRSH
jgi:hypothetical protein